MLWTLSKVYIKKARRAANKKHSSSGCAICGHPVGFTYVETRDFIICSICDMIVQEDTTYPAHYSKNMKVRYTSEKQGLRGGS